MKTGEGLFQRGDVVLHPKRPEWGEGVVDQTTTITHEGKQAQRVVVKFTHHGRVTLNTGIAPLQPKGINVEAEKKDDGPKPFNTRPAIDMRSIKEEQARAAAESEAAAAAQAAKANAADPNVPLDPTQPVAHSQDSGWLASLNKKTADQLSELPHAMSDPFASHSDRLGAVLDSFRFSADARGLMDWAITQTHMEDPLSRYTRHELEQAFPFFVRNRNDYLFEIVREIKREGKHQLLSDISRKTRNKQAKAMLDRAIRA